MEIIYKKINEITPYENNPRFNDDTVEYVANSIEEFGFKVPLVIDKNNVIVTGHTRYKASLKLGLENIPCIIADDLTDEQVKAFRLVDNKVSEKSMWNYDLLDEELKSILDIDMSIFDFDLEMESIDFENLDDEREKTKVNVSIVFESIEEFNRIKEELEKLSEKANGNLSYKMI